MERFIPAHDDWLFTDTRSLDALGGRLVPYQVGMPCLHWEAVIETPDGEERVLDSIRVRASGHPRAEPPAPGHAPR